MFLRFYHLCQPLQSPPLPARFRTGRDTASCVSAFSTSSSSSSAAFRLCVPAVILFSRAKDRPIRANWHMAKSRKDLLFDQGFLVRLQQLHLIAKRLAARESGGAAAADASATGSNSPTTDPTCPATTSASSTGLTTPAWNACCFGCSINAARPTCSSCSTRPRRWRPARFGRAQRAAAIGPGRRHAEVRLRASRRGGAGVRGDGRARARDRPAVLRRTRQAAADRAQPRADIGGAGLPGRARAGRSDATGPMRRRARARPRRAGQRAAGQRPARLRRRAVRCDRASQGAWLRGDGAAHLLAAGRRPGPGRARWFSSRPRPVRTWRWT